MPSRKTVAKTPGIAYLVGAGPGDLQLLTLRAKAVLHDADVVVFDFLANERLLEWAPKAKTIYVGKRSARHTLSQDEINALLVREAGRGKRVVRLKGGDPFLFGRGGEEAAALAAAGVAFEIVPGVSSAISVPAYAGIPVTHRHRSASLAIVTGHELTGKDAGGVPFDALARFGTVVMLMGVKLMRENFARLLAEGMPPSTPAAAIQWGTTANQRTVFGTLADLPDKASAAGLGAPALIVIGETVGLRDQLNWFETRPWFGKRIVITRSKDASAEFVEWIENRGAVAVEVPSIGFANPKSFASLDKGIRNLAKYDWVVFTSVNGVEHFWARMAEQGKDARAFGSAKVAVVGPVTARAVAHHGVKPDAMPKEFRGAKLAESLGGKLRGKRILLVRAEEGSEEFPTAAQRAGAKLDMAVAYRTVPAKRPKGFQAVDNTGRIPDLHVFASPSAVQAYRRMLRPAEKEALRGAPVACIGPVTAEAACKAGFAVAVLPEKNSMDGLKAALERHFGGAS